MVQRSRNENQAIGKINIADEVVATITGISTAEVNGVFGMSSGKLSEGITELIGKKI